eukprot:299877-Rhodomonas_salina.5
MQFGATCLHHCGAEIYTGGICLRVQYAMSGTDLECGTGRMPEEEILAKFPVGKSAVLSLPKPRRHRHTLNPAQTQTHTSAGSTICLPARYAMPGTKTALRRACYAMPGTEIAYAATRMGRC